jgi:hypothetical protein
MIRSDARRPLTAGGDGDETLTSPAFDGLTNA